MLLNAATTMKAFGEAEASIPYYEDVRGVYEKYLDPDDARFGGLYGNMALALADCGQYGEAEGRIRKSGACRYVLEKKNGALESAITHISMAGFTSARSATAKARSDGVWIRHTNV